MNLKDKEGWKKAQANNTDPYGNCAIRVARRVMELLDDVKEVKAKDLVKQANKELDAGLSGFLAGAVAGMVSKFHKRGEEFRISWNQDVQITDEGDKANDSGGILNPALLTVKLK